MFLYEKKQLEFSIGQVGWLQEKIGRISEKLQL